MPAQRRVGMDHEHYEWLPLSKRGVLRWPEQARVALCALVNLEHTEWQPPGGSVQVVTPVGGLAVRPFPDYTRLSHREYGHRVGIFRVLDVLDKYGIKATVAMDALTAEHYPYLVRHCLQRGCEIIGHGMSASRMISSKMSEQDERDYIQTSIQALKRATGQAPAGWLGPEYGESARTPQLLAQAGLRYVCDWTNDEQPYRMKTAEGELFSLPIMLELDDLHAMGDRRVPVTRYADMLREGFERLYRDGARNGPLLVLHLHPWLSGQPFRIRYLDGALGAMLRRQGVWAAQGAEIIDWYRRNPPAAP
ncbi:MAG TPA: polysaccharide deacetylase family protein [Candidatus Tectomicrobia bacterium]|nr:polysaccharide deacetylase family protein [Candidatus Tectomicrobia bacterium]